MARRRIPRRFIYYGLFIVASVGLGVFLFSEKRTAYETNGHNEPPRPAWKPSKRAKDEANEEFTVESDFANLIPAVGKGTGADWPQFNGPNRDNRSLETGLLKSWPEEGPKLLWTTRGIGPGYSSVAVVKGVVYTMGNKGDNEAIVALDAGTGQKIWSTPFAWASKPQVGDGPRSTPAVSEGAVYGLGAGGDLVCLAADTGEVRWNKNILKEFEGTNLGWGICESVLVDGNRLVCTPGGKKGTIVALDKRTGDVLWQTIVDQDCPSYASATFAEVDGVRQYIQFTNTGTVGVRADNGEFLWRDNSAANASANCSSPLVAGNNVFSASSYSVGGSLLRLGTTDSKPSAEFVYHTPKMKSHHGDMVIVDGLLYGVDDSILTCIQLETGKVKWQDRSVGKGAVTYADGCIYLRGEAEEVALVEATGDRYRELGRFKQPKRSQANAWAHPAVAEGKLFLRDQGLLLCYDLKSAP